MRSYSRQDGFVSFPCHFLYPLQPRHVLTSLLLLELKSLALGKILPLWSHITYVLMSYEIWLFGYHRKFHRQQKGIESLKFFFTNLSFMQAKKNEIALISCRLWSSALWNLKKKQKYQNMVLHLRGNIPFSVLKI